MYVGIDICSVTTKIAVTERGKLSFTEVVPTGYGRENVSKADRKITEMTCHAKGAKHLYPKVRSVIDIGRQDPKFISIGDDGTVSDFVMNDKCSAGTGRFLEEMTRAMEVDLSYGEVDDTMFTPETLRRKGRR